MAAGHLTSLSTVEAMFEVARAVARIDWQYGVSRLVVKLKPPKIVEVKGIRPFAILLLHNIHCAHAKYEEVVAISCAAMIG